MTSGDFLLAVRVARAIPTTGPVWDQPELHIAYLQSLAESFLGEAGLGQDRLVEHSTR